MPLPRVSPAEARFIRQYIKRMGAERERIAEDGAIQWEAPQTRDELWEKVRDTWGVEIPREVHPDCVHRGHVAPFTAFADSFFAETEIGALIPVSLWLGSRGLSGKTFLLALLAISEQVWLGSEVSLLGGSLEQSQKAHAYTREFWENPNAPHHLLLADPTERRIRLRNGGEEFVHTASTKSVRGAHPQRLRPDEADEMDMDVLDSAMGMPMSKNGVRSQVTITSTHHKAKGPVTELKRRMKDGEQDIKLYEWCLMESLQRTNDKGEIVGWLSPEEAELAERRMPHRMWLVEVLLQEPSVEDRAIKSSAIDTAFEPIYGKFDGKIGEYIEVPCCKVYIERLAKYTETPWDFGFKKPAPCRHHQYVTGIDWGRIRDHTVIVTYRTDGADGRWWMVAWESLAGDTESDWVDIDGRANARMERFPGYAAHDRGGAGDRASAYLDFTPVDVLIQGERRKNVFNNYIRALEHGQIVHPRITSAYDDHRFVTREDLFGTGSSNHPPDSVVAGALAWYMYRGAPNYKTQWGGPQGSGILGGLA